jgi:phosphomannomutase
MDNLIPNSWDTDAIDTNSLAIDVTERLFPDYVKDVVKLGFGRYLSKILHLICSCLRDRSLPRFVYTPMHGVGMKIFESVIHSLGFEGSVCPVSQQVTSLY